MASSKQPGLLSSTTAARSGCWSTLTTHFTALLNADYATEYAIQYAIAS
jgi:hypothetical protein